VADLDPNFKYEVAREPGGENIRYCFACGTCTASCPVRAVDEKYNPRKIIRMVLLGMKEEVLKSEFIWLCSTCYTCHERCPQDVRITDVMNALKNIAVREGYCLPAYAGQIDLIAESGKLYAIDDFDNKKRGKVGLPEVDTYVGAAKEIFELTKVKEKIAGKKPERG
jgi:heterodisulfide reductase subunit C